MGIEESAIVIDKRCEKNGGELRNNLKFVSE